MGVSSVRLNFERQCQPYIELLMGIRVRVDQNLVLKLRTSSIGFTGMRVPASPSKGVPGS